MAHKKSIPSKNSIFCRGSSSSSSLPSRDRFHDSKSQKDFEENFCDRTIHSERHVILSDFLDTLLPMRLALEVGNLFAKNPLGVPTCLYRNSTPTYTLSIPLFSSLLHYSKEHLS